MPSPGRGPFPGSLGLEVRHESTTIRHISNQIEENLAVAKERRRQDGGTAVANAAVTGTGSSVSVAVQCVPGQSTSATHGMQATVRC
jgi:hypothetical protein